MLFYESRLIQTDITFKALKSVISHLPDTLPSVRPSVFHRCGKLLCLAVMAVLSARHSALLPRSCQIVKNN